MLSLLAQDRAKLALRYSRMRSPPMTEQVDMQLQVRAFPYFSRKKKNRMQVFTLQ